LQQRSTATKCSYSIVVNEISGSKCPELLRQIQTSQNDQQQQQQQRLHRPQEQQNEEEEHPQQQQQQRKRQRYQNTNNNNNVADASDVEDVRSELKALELEFYKEILKLKESNSTLREMENRIIGTEQKLMSMERDSSLTNGS
jgi:FtsZ-interacting cell division protein YlmF